MSRHAAQRQGRRRRWLPTAAAVVGVAAALAATAQVYAAVTAAPRTTTVPRWMTPTSSQDNSSPDRGSSGPGADTGQGARRADVAPADPNKHLVANPSPAAVPTPTVNVKYVFPVAGCNVDYVGTHHDYPAADMFADRGCDFVAPVDGRIDEVTRVDTWDSSTNEGAPRGGLSISLVGVDGVRYYGSHLEEVEADIKPGLVVTAGTLLGHIGDTGSAAGTGTHLHFAISWPTPPGYWWIRRGTVLPQPYLDSWRQGHDTSPAAAVEKARRQYGDDTTCHTYC